MKNLIKIFCVLLISPCCFYAAMGQSKKTPLLVNDQNYVFVANYINPSRGGGKALTNAYDVTVSKDSIVTYLPYYGRAYLADYGSTDEGIKFTWTHFDYKITSVDKKGNFEILITPKNKSIGDTKAVQSMRLYISSDGYASLQITNVNRDPVSFNGTIEERIKPKGI